MREHTDWIVVHCSNGGPQNISLDEMNIEHIRDLHAGDPAQRVKWNWVEVNKFGWSDVGYHYVIGRCGRIEEGRDMDAIGAHVRGYNKTALGICLIGGADGKFDFTKYQIHALEVLVNGLVLKYKKAAVIGHNYLNTKKSCPGFNVHEWYYGGR